VKSGSWPAPAIIFDRRLLMRMMAVNRDIMIRSFTLLYAFAFFMSRSAEQGDTILAANALLEKFIMVGAFFLDGLATAAEQLAGRAVGARYRPAFDRTLQLTALWSFSLAGLLAYLIWAVLTPLFGVLAFQMDGVFIGATWSSTMRNMMLLSLAIYLAAYHALFPLLGNHGLWLAFLLFFGIRGVTLLAACRKRAAQTFA
jgi:MATE family multidrug resistance protein